MINILWPQSNLSVAWHFHSLLIPSEAMGIATGKDLAQRGERERYTKPRGKPFKAAAAGNRAVALEKKYAEPAQGHSKVVYPNELSSSRRKRADCKSKKAHYRR